MSLLPTFATDTDTIDTALEIPYEYGIDFETGKLTGCVVNGLEAVKVWIWLALKTERYRYAIYDWEYGFEHEKYIGHSYSQEYLDTTLQEDVKDTLFINEHITDVTDFTCEIVKDKLSMSFIAVTDFGEVQINV